MVLVRKGGEGKPLQQGGKNLVNWGRGGRRRKEGRFFRLRLRRLWGSVGTKERGAVILAQQANLKGGPQGKKFLKKEGEKFAEKKSVEEGEGKRKRTVQ